MGTHKKGNILNLVDEFKDDPSYKERPELDICYPDIGEKGKILDTYGNLKCLLDRIGATVRWNSMRWFREVSVPNHDIFSDDEENSSLRVITNLAKLNKMPSNSINEHLTTLAQLNHYHPIVECIQNKPWDRVERLQKFINTVKTSDDAFSHKLIYRWMLMAIEAAFSPKGIAPQGVLVLQGKQRIGKTTFFKNLDPINCGAIMEGAILDPTNKDIVFTLGSHWINELGELDASFKKIDIARAKSYITSQYDILRMPYERRNSRMPRRSVCGASVNEDKFLVDGTGNRRWWVIPVESIDLEHGLDMQQVWAEVRNISITGDSSKLTEEEAALLNNKNEEFEKIDPLEEKVLQYFHWNSNWKDLPPNKMSSTRVIEFIGFKPDQGSCMRMSNILTKLTGMKSKKSDGCRYFLLPPKKGPDEIGRL